MIKLNFLALPRPVAIIPVSSFEFDRLKSNVKNPMSACALYGDAKLSVISKIRTWLETKVGKHDEITPAT